MEEQNIIDHQIPEQEGQELEVEVDTPQRTKKKRILSKEHIEKMKAGRLRKLEQQKKEKLRKQLEDVEETIPPEPAMIITKPKPKRRVKKRVVNNYYYDDEESEEEVENNYYNRKPKQNTLQRTQSVKPTKTEVFEESSSEDEGYDYNPMGNIQFR